MKISSIDALEKLKLVDEKFIQLFVHGSLEVEIYSPQKIDNQKPHSRDEVYVIISGSGLFNHEGDLSQFNPGDLIFVPAGDEHRFESFTDDLSTWVIFYGPNGGEK